MPTIQKRNNSYLITVSCGYDLTGKYDSAQKPYISLEGNNHNFLLRGVHMKRYIRVNKTTLAEFNTLTVDEVVSLLLSIKELEGKNIQAICRSTSVDFLIGDDFYMCE